MSKDLDLYRKRYIEAVRIAMAERGTDQYKEIVDFIKISTVTLSAIIGERQYPTLQHGIDLCKSCKISANWLFLGKGEMSMEDQHILNDLAKLIKKL